MTTPAQFQREGRGRDATAPRHTRVPSLRYSQSQIGANCVLSFGHEGTREYRCRVRSIYHGWEVIAQEAQGRYYRSFYPRKASIAQFGIQVELVNEAENSDFMRYMEFFVQSMLNRNANHGITRISLMTVNIPARNFLRYGIPIGGMMYDHHVGSMVFSPIIVFEAARDPLDPEFKPEQSASFQESNDPQQRYFFPSGSQLKAGQGADSSLYDVTQGALDSILNPGKPDIRESLPGGRGGI